MERFDIDKTIEILGLDMRADVADEGRDFDVACRIAVEKLRKCKDYEDTNLTPEQIDDMRMKLDEYVQLEENGLLTRTKLAIGTEVFFVSPGRKKYFRHEVKVIVNDFFLGIRYYFFSDMKSHLDEVGHSRAGFGKNYIGKYIFLSESEAQEALERMVQNG